VVSVHVCVCGQMNGESIGRDMVIGIR
jgi:hypothetical protein